MAFYVEFVLAFLPERDIERVVLHHPRIFALVFTIVILFVSILRASTLFPRARTCGACNIYRAYKDDGDYLKRLAEHFNCRPEKVRCEGCQALTSNCWGSDCKIVQCLGAKDLEFCYQCKQYEEHSCEKFEDLAKPYLEENGVDLRANLERIRKGEAEIKAWLKESEKKFRCPKCGNPLPSGSFRSKCYHCGAELSR